MLFGQAEFIPAGVKDLMLGRDFGLGVIHVSDSMSAEGFVFDVENSRVVGGKA